MNISYFQLLSWRSVVNEYKLLVTVTVVNAPLDAELTYKQSKQVLEASGFKGPKKLFSLYNGLQKAASRLKSP